MHQQWRSQTLLVGRGWGAVVRVAYLHRSSKLRRMGFKNTREILINIFLNFIRRIFNNFLC